MTSLTGEGWKRLSEHLDLEARLAASPEPVIVTAELIKEISGREPRLMSKFDTRESRPPALARATILPITNGKYAILGGDGYAELPPPTKEKHWQVSQCSLNLGTLPWKTGPTSESQALDMANATGLLQDFLGDPGACLTIRGRLRSPRFDFEFDTRCGTVPLTVDGVQIEVDSGFEGASIHLIEAKLGARTNFHIRQLYYPVRMWRTLLPEKSVSASFLTWSNRCFSLRKYQFEPLLRYQALTLADSVDYYFDQPEPIPNLEELLETTPERNTPNLPFPQADDVRRVGDVADALSAGVVTRAGIAERFDLDERQADYYANAAAYLGLLERNTTGFALTAFGAQLVTLPYASRQTLLLRQIIQRPVFRRSIQLLCETGHYASREQIAEWIAETSGLCGQTPLRRASTVLAWTRWARQSANPAQLELWGTAQPART
jgi:hypothetical protein